LTKPQKQTNITYIYIQIQKYIPIYTYAHKYCLHKYHIPTYTCTHALMHIYYLLRALMRKNEKKRCISEGKNKKQTNKKNK